MADPDPPAPKRKLPIAVLLSGGGTTMLNLAERIADGTLPAEVRLVVASNPAAKGIARAERLGLPVRVVPRREFTSGALFSEFIFAHLRDAGVELVCLAGFLSLLTIPEDYERRVMNIHPSLLPKFGGKGMHGRAVHEAVLAAGEVESGCTVHFADNTYDTGPVILQRRCPVLPGDTPETLAARVFEQECVGYPEAVAGFAAGRL
ncbi:MAG: phosphoribosylglycinamide formyltransferase [Planctomycetota bacterium]